MSLDCLDLELAQPALLEPLESLEPLQSRVFFSTPDHFSGSVAEKERSVTKWASRSAGSRESVGARARPTQSLSVVSVEYLVPLCQVRGNLV